VSDRAIELLNDLLKIYNRESGEYLNLVGDSSLVTPSFSTEVKINNINTGAISNPLEYSRRLFSFLINQLDLRNTVDSWLDYMGGVIYNVIRFSGESDTDYRNRIFTNTTTVKCSPIGIKIPLDDYADNVQIIEGGMDGAFADVSFADSDREFNIPGVWVVKSAITMEENGSPFFIIIIMENVDPGDYVTILNLINAYRACGILFTVIIV